MVYWYLKRNRIAFEKPAGAGLKVDRKRMYNISNPEHDITGDFVNECVCKTNSILREERRLIKGDALSFSIAHYI